VIILLPDDIGLFGATLNPCTGDLSRSRLLRINCVGAWICGRTQNLTGNEKLISSPGVVYEFKVFIDRV